MLKMPVDHAVATAFVVMGVSTSKTKRNRVDAPEAELAAARAKEGLFRHIHHSYEGIKDHTFFSP